MEDNLGLAFQGARWQLTDQGAVDHAQYAIFFAGILVSPSNPTHWNKTRLVISVDPT